MDEQMRAEGQLGMDERVVTDAALEAALDDRERARGVLAEARKDRRAADALVAEMLEADPYRLGDGEALRVGPYRITRQHRDAAVVSFERGPSDRVVVERVG